MDDVTLRQLNVLAAAIYWLNKFIRLNFNRKPK